jgi:hypothetical protein
VVMEKDLDLQQCPVTCSEWTSVPAGRSQIGLLKSVRLCVRERACVCVQRQRERKPILRERP